MSKICKKYFDQITTKSFINSKSSQHKMKQNYTLCFSLLTIFVFATLFGFIEFVDAADDRTKLEAELINQSTGKDDGKAKFEQRPDRVTLSVEIEDQKSNSSFTIKVDGKNLGGFTTDGSGFADINMDSRDGDNIPSVTSGSMVEVFDSNGIVVLSGKMIGTEATQSSDSQTQPPDTPPVSTTSVIIPLGAKDKDVSEFYLPSSISVSLSETVTWTNKDDTEHTVTSRSNDIFNSGLFGTNQSFSHQFTINGAFDYFCQLHPWMTGTVIAGSGGDVSVPTPPPSDPPAPPTEPLPPGSSQFTVTIPSGATLQTVDEYYSPPNLSINSTDSITWQNKDDAFHTVTNTEEELFDSGLFGPGKSFSFQFNKGGTFDYLCIVHPWMTGSVIVLGQDKSNQNDLSTKLLSPLKQLKNGIMAPDVQCKSGFDLILRITKDMGACVKSSSLSVLIQRGWGQ